jgi:hypothetical protein
VDVDFRGGGHGCDCDGWSKDEGLVRASGRKSRWSSIYRSRADRIRSG